MEVCDSTAAGLRRPVFLQRCLLCYCRVDASRNAAVRRLDGVPCGQFLAAHICAEAGDEYRVVERVCDECYALLEQWHSMRRILDKLGASISDKYRRARLKRRSEHVCISVGRLMIQLQYAAFLAHIKGRRLAWRDAVRVVAAGILNSASTSACASSAEAPPPSVSPVPTAAAAAAAAAGGGGGGCDVVSHFDSVSPAAGDIGAGSGGGGGDQSRLSATRRSYSVRVVRPSSYERGGGEGGRRGGEEGRDGGEEGRGGGEGGRDGGDGADSVDSYCADYDTSDYCSVLSRRRWSGAERSAVPQSHTSATTRSLPVVRLSHSTPVIFATSSAASSAAAAAAARAGTHVNRLAYSSSSCATATAAAAAAAFNAAAFESDVTSVCSSVDSSCGSSQQLLLPPPPLPLQLSSQRSHGVVSVAPQSRHSVLHNWCGIAAPLPLRQLPHLHSTPAGLMHDAAAAAGLSINDSLPSCSAAGGGTAAAAGGGVMFRRGDTLATAPLLCDQLLSLAREREETMSVLSVADTASLLDRTETMSMLSDNTDTTARMDELSTVSGHSRCGALSVMGDSGVDTGSLGRTNHTSHCGDDNVLFLEPFSKPDRGANSTVECGDDLLREFAETMSNISEGVLLDDLDSYFDLDSSVCTTGDTPSIGEDFSTTVSSAAELAAASAAAANSNSVISCCRRQQQLQLSSAAAAAAAADDVDRARVMADRAELAACRQRQLQCQHSGGQAEYTGRLCCPLCDRLFDTRRQLCAHMRRHSAAPFQCRLCRQQFALYYKLHLHMRSVHRGAVRAAERGAGAATGRTDKRGLALASKATRQSQQAGARPAQFSTLASSTQPPPPPPSLAPLAAAAAPLAAAVSVAPLLSAHPAATGSCSSPSVSSSCSSRSSSTKMAGAGDYCCEQCGRTFRQAATLRRHRRTHAGDGRFVCCVCQRRFINSYDLRRHMDTHQSDKPYTCTVCARSFKLATSLSVHRKLHSSTAAHTCRQCGRQFDRRDSLAKHLDTHKPERDLQCDRCGRKFKQRRTLAKHQRVMHPD